MDTDKSKSYSLAHASPTRLTISVQATHTELEPLLPRAAAAISEEMEIQGFRKGKAPYDVVKAKVGEFAILETAARRYIQNTFEEILKDVERKEYSGKSFEPVGEPEIAITKLALPNIAEQHAGGRAPEDILEFRITLSLLPAIELPDYRAVAKRVLQTKHIAETTEDEVREAVGWLRESRTKLITVHRAAAMGDRVEADFEASSGGRALAGGQSKNHPFILGTGRFIPGFEHELIGMKSGEEKSFTLDAPPDWRDAALAGRAVTFGLTMNLVQERRVPEWDDELARTLGDFASTAAAERSIRDGITAEKAAKERERIRIAIASAIAAETRADIPETMIERESEKMTAELRKSISAMGLEFPRYLEHLKKNETDLAREWRPDAERRVKIALVLREIARREGIRPSAEEIEASAARALGHKNPADKGEPALDRKAFIAYHSGVARNEKVFRWLENLGS